MFAELEGQIEKITYTSVETGFTIAKVKVDGHRGLVTAVGNIAIEAETCALVLEI